MSLLDLARRCEAAEADEQRGLLMEAWDAIHGPRPKFSKANAYRSDSEWSVWYDRRGTYTRMLGVGAYESAAMSLIPEGHAWDLAVSSTAIAARVYPDGAEDVDDARVGCTTPALALCAASLRAREGGE